MITDRRKFLLRSSILCAGIRCDLFHFSIGPTTTARKKSTLIGSHPGSSPPAATICFIAGRATVYDRYKRPNSAVFPRLLKYRPGIVTVVKTRSNAGELLNRQPRAVALKNGKPDCCSSESV